MMRILIFIAAVVAMAAGIYLVPKYIGGPEELALEQPAQATSTEPAEAAPKGPAPAVIKPGTREAVSAESLRPAEQREIVDPVAERQAQRETSPSGQLVGNLEGAQAGLPRRNRGQTSGASIPNQAIPLGGQIPPPPGSDPVQDIDDALDTGTDGDILVIEVSGQASGFIEIQLLPQIAPQNVERLKTLARQGSYDGVVFHRVINGFMAQTGDVQYGRAGAGDPARMGTGNSNLPNLPAEFSDIRYETGTVGMARTSDPNSANSQFFIMFGRTPSLDGQYTVVGRVISGMDVVRDIKRGDPQSGAVSGSPDVMTKVRLAAITREQAETEAAAAAAAEAEAAAAEDGAEGEEAEEGESSN